MLFVACHSARGSVARSVRSAAFSTSIQSRQHFLGATPEMFEKIVIQGDDRVVLVDFYAEYDSCFSLAGRCTDM